MAWEGRDLVNEYYQPKEEDMSKIKSNGLRLAFTLLSVLLVAGLVAACGGSDSTDTDAADTSETAASASESDFVVGKFAEPNLTIVAEDQQAFGDLPISFTDVVSGPESLPLLTSGDLSVTADVGVPPVSIGLVQGVKMKVVWVGYKATMKLLVKPTIKSAEDLKGKTFGLPAGSSPHVMLLEYLDENGISRDEINLVEMGSPEGVGAFKSGAIDGTVATDPFMTEIEDAGAAVLDEDYVVAAHIMGTQAIENDAAAAQAYICGLAAVQEAARKDPQTAWASIAKALELPEKDVEVMLPQDAIIPLDEMTSEQYLAPGGQYAQQVAAAADILAELGELEGGLTVDEASEGIDTQFIEAAQNGQCDQ